MKQKYNAITGQRMNVGPVERIASVLGGSYLLYDAFAKRGKNIFELLAAGYLLFRGTTGYCYGYHAIRRTGESANESRNINIKTSVTVNRPRSEVYNFWRRLENLPLFMKHLERVSALDEKTSEWTVKIPGEMGSVSWKSEIVKEEPDMLIGWHSLPGAAIENAGKVDFRDAGKFGTEVHAVISYRAPFNVAGEGVAKLLNPVFEEMVKDDIRNFKRYMETGEVPTIAGQPSGKQ